jgi:hypothetical protein
MLLASMLKDISYVSHNRLTGPLYAADKGVVNNLSLAWAHAADDEQVRLFAARFLQRYQVAARELGLYHPFVYVNYADKGQDVFSSYGERNKRRLIEIQRSVDPMGVFTSKGLWRGFFKLL